MIIRENLSWPILCKKFWGKGFGTEAANAIFVLLPHLILRGYKSEHVPLKKLVATARLDNPASQKILENAGFQKHSVVERFGVSRNFYTFSAKQVKNHYAQFFTRLDRERWQESRNKLLDQQVDVTAAEMAASQFGQQSLSAKQRRR